MTKQMIVSTRIPEDMSKEMKEVVKGNFLNEADFFRSAIRDEITKYKITQIKEEFAKTKNSTKAVRELRRLLSQIEDEDYEKWVKEGSKDLE